MFGPEIYSDWFNEDAFNGHDVKEGDHLLDVKLSLFERKLFLLTEVASRHAKFEMAAIVKNNRPPFSEETNLEFRQWGLKDQLAGMIRDAFWIFLYTNHPVTQKPGSVGIRTSWKVVVPAKRDLVPGPSLELLPIGDVGGAIASLLKGLQLKKECVEEEPGKCDSCPANTVCPIISKGKTHGNA